MYGVYVQDICIGSMQKKRNWPNLNGLGTVKIFKVGGITLPKRGWVVIPDTLLF